MTTTSTHNIIRQRLIRNIAVVLTFGVCLASGFFYAALNLKAFAENKQVIISKDFEDNITVTIDPSLMPDVNIKRSGGKMSIYVPDNADGVTIAPVLEKALLVNTRNNGKGKVITIETDQVYMNIQSVQKSDIQQALKTGSNATSVLKRPRLTLTPVPNIQIQDPKPTKAVKAPTPPAKPTIKTAKAVPPKPKATAKVPVKPAVKPTIAKKAPVPAKTPSAKPVETASKTTQQSKPKKVAAQPIPTPATNDEELNTLATDEGELFQELGEDGVPIGAEEGEFFGLEDEHADDAFELNAIDTTVEQPLAEGGTDLKGIILRVMLSLVLVLIMVVASLKWLLPRLMQRYPVFFNNLKQKHQTRHIEDITDGKPQDKRSLYSSGIPLPKNQQARQQERPMRDDTEKRTSRNNSLLSKLGLDSKSNPNAGSDAIGIGGLLGNKRQHKSQNADLNFDPNDDQATLDFLLLQKDKPSKGLNIDTIPAEEDIIDKHTLRQPPSQPIQEKPHPLKSKPAPQPNTTPTAPANLGFDRTATKAPVAESFNAPAKISHVNPVAQATPAMGAVIGAHEDDITVLKTTPLTQDNDLHVVEVNQKRFVVATSPYTTTFITDVSPHQSADDVISELLGDPFLKRTLSPSDTPKAVASLSGNAKPQAAPVPQPKPVSKQAVRKPIQVDDEPNAPRPEATGSTSAYVEASKRQGARKVASNSRKKPAGRTPDVLKQADSAFEKYMAPKARPANAPANQPQQQALVQPRSIERDRAAQQAQGVQQQLGFERRPAQPQQQRPAPQTPDYADEPFYNEPSTQVPTSNPNVDLPNFSKSTSRYASAPQAQQPVVAPSRQRQPIAQDAPHYVDAEEVIVLKDYDDVF